MTNQLLTEHNLEFLSFKGGGGCTGSTESTFVKMPHCCKSHVTGLNWDSESPHCPDASKASAVQSHMVWEKLLF